MRDFCERDLDSESVGDVQIALDAQYAHRGPVEEVERAENILQELSGLNDIDFD